MFAKKLTRMTMAILLLIGVILTGGAKKPSKVTKPERIKIGYINPFTGDAASWGEEGKMALTIGLEEINSGDGIDGSNLEIIYEDTKAVPKEGISVVKKLIEVDKVPMLVGPGASSVGLAIAPIANKSKVVILATGCTAAELTEKGGPYFFRVIPSDAFQAKIAAAWTRDLGYKKVAVLYVENSWGIGLKDSFVKEFKKIGGKITIIESSEQDARDFMTQLIKIKDTNPDAIYAPLYQKAAGVMLKQAKEMGIKTQVIGADAYSFPELREAAGDAANGVLFTTFGSYKGKEYQDFAKKFKAKYGNEPSSYSCYNYDALKITAAVIKSVLDKGQEVTGKNIQKEMAKIKGFRGATGITTFDKNGDVITKTFDKMMIKAGEVVPYIK